MADLDRRIGAEVDRSAAVIARGREELDAVRQWVLAAASSVPKSAAREQMIVPIVAKGTNGYPTIPPPRRRWICTTTKSGARPR
ncbi:MAG: hypothetical protein VYB90_09925 [Actinomycetota bacterium]|nr:hypothetical protein [Actinomycetota bacterium]